MPGEVAIGYVHDTDLTVSFHQSLTGMLGYEMARGDHLGPWIARRCSSDPAGLAGVRNSVVRDFLGTDAEWLLWLDTDMGFEPNTLERLLAVADPEARPIVGALCFSMREMSHDGMGGRRTAPIPVIYDLGQHPTDNVPAYLPRRDYPRNSVVRCSGTGSACVLIHRSAFEKVAAKYLPDGQGWYDHVRLSPETAEKGGWVVAEDLSFCQRAATVGVPTHVHTGVKTTHMKNVWLGEDRYLAETWPDPANEPCAVIVPVLSRPQNAAPFMESLRASTGLATAYFICDPDDDAEIEAALAAGAEVLTHTGAHGTFSAKANFGYRNTTEPWLLFVGDDVIFRPGWYDRAIRAAGERFSVVGTNDLSGIVRDLAVHPLVRRSYIDEQGGSWDGPGVMCHEGYRHNFVDNEWTAVAAQRGVFVSAPDAVVEHMHPIFEKAKPDAIYQKGADNYDRDKRLWEKRAKEHMGRPLTGVRNPQACMTVEPSGFSLEASVAAYQRQWEEIPGLIKVHEDLDRYERIIKDTQPEVIVECGTYSGVSAAWFADLGPEVITIDTYTDHPIDLADMPPKEGVTYLKGSSTDPDVIAQVAEMVAGRRCMVVLDSDHTASHVAAELLAYSKLVTPGCYLVVEDTIVRWVPGTPVTEFGPMDAVEAFFLRPGWEHDDDIQNLHPVTHHPKGWWKKL